ncbi:MAG: autotransporter-associated beta strand repeat-containing protein, partial [Verrucomicrobiales bacterium]|nr:autotransporter-associated beta strand repeat-containing protein [Verrucomicrobiales bacterium]
SSRDTNNPIYRPKLTISYQGAGISWAGAVNGNWDTTTANWNVGGYAGLFGSGDHVTFADGAANTSITVASGGVAPASVLISNSSTAYMFSGGRIGGAGGLTKRGSGQATLASSNSYGGLTLVEAGRLIASANGALGTTTAGTTVSSGAALGLQNVGYTTPEPLAIAGSGPAGSGALYASGNSVFGGAVLLMANSTIGVEPFGSLTLTNAISGDNNVVKTGAGTLVFAGSVPNTYGGATYVNQGTLVLAKTAGEAVPGDLVIGDGINPATVRLDNHGQLSGGDFDVVVNTGSQLNLNNYSAGISGMLSLSNGSVVTGTGTLVLAGTVRSAGNQTNTISGRLDLGGGVRLFDVGDGTAVDDLVVSAEIAGGGITKQGPGRLVLSGNNTFGGTLAITSGQVAANSSGALGSVAGGTTVADGARLELRGGIAVGAEPLTLNGTGGGLGALYSATGNNSWAGTITLGSASAIGCDPAATLTVSGTVNAAGHDLSFYGGGNITVHGAITGAGSSVTKVGPGVLTFGGSAPNTYTGPTVVSMGQLVLGKLGAVAIPGQLTIGTFFSQASVSCLGPGQFGLGATATINPASLLDLNGYGARLAGLTLLDAAVETDGGVLEMAGPVACMGSSGSSINGKLSFSGIQDINVKDGTVLLIGASITSGGFNKYGAGTIVLTNVNTVLAGCTINDGAVLVNNPPRAGYGLGPGPVTVTGRGVLGGAGSISGPVNLTGGVLSPGGAVGVPAIDTLIVSNNVVLGPGSVLRIEAGRGPGSIDTLDLQHGGALAIDPNAVLQLIGALEGTEPYIFVRRAQAVSGTFKDLPEGAEVPGQPGWYIHYGTHRVYLSRVPKPIAYFRAFSTNDVVLLMWRTGEEVDTKWFDIYEWKEAMWLQLNKNPIIPQSPTGAVYMMVHPYPNQSGQEPRVFKLVANTSDGEESWIFERDITEFKFSAFPRITEQGVEVRWLSRTDETYDLQWTADIGQPLVPVLTDVPATPPECVVIHQTTNAQGYYRVRMVP